MILGASILQLPAIKKAKELGLDVIVLDMDEDAVGLKVPGVYGEIISTIDTPKILEMAKKYDIDGIMTLATDMPMRSVAKVAKELGLVGITEETALKATNKAEMRSALKEYGVPIPKFYRVSCMKEYIDATQHFSKCFIVKPADSSGSRGIYKIDDINNCEMIEEAYKYSVQYSRTGDVVVEEYMSGPEVSVETISVSGKCYVIQVTDKVTTGAPHFVEIGHSQPSLLDEDTIEKIKKVTEDANRAIGIIDGPSHTEIIVTQEGPKIVELGARLGGDNINTHLVPLSTGVDMVECCINIALGEKPDIVAKWNKGSAIRYFKQHKGYIRCISGIEKAKELMGVKEISVVHGVGRYITDIESSGSRMGFVITQGESAEKAIDYCEKAMGMIDILIE